MKKALVLIISIALFVSANAQAHIRRVGYSGPQVSGIDYSDVNAAVQAAIAGDTIQLYQNASVGSASVNKQLTFIGFGYLLDVNIGLQAIPSASNSVTLNFNQGSAGSIVQGVYGSFNIGTENITISRCAGSVYLGWNSNVGNVSIETATVISSNLNNLSGTNGAVSNVLISNSIIYAFNCPNVAGLVSNNICTLYSNFGACVVKNNIFTHSGYCPSGTSAVFQNNLLAIGSCNITGSGNHFGTDMNSIFLNWNNGNYTTEKNLVLKSGSLAIGYGIDGNGNATDVGIYGGEPAFVYKPSGIPAIPAIYQLSAPQLNASTNPYTITVSVRSNN